jgi:class 3 adenylate cyclase/tetratricopeptide (TPR) repeat protein
MHCPRCEQEAPADAAFCPKCGARLSATCQHCGTIASADDNFCRRCGQSLSNPGSAIGDRFATPQAYTPQHLAQKILSAKTAIEGERKYVTVLFADLKSSMELLADRDPEQARQILDPVLELMIEAVHRYEGTVNQVMGDGIMALFGAPIAHEDHAVRACYTALRMQESVKRCADDMQRAHGMSPQIRIGLNSGEVVVRAIGSDLHMDYTAVGQTTHLAARMEQIAVAGSIVATRQTIALVEGYIETRTLGVQAVKGLSSPIEIYEVVSATEARSRLEAALGHDLSPFVGRQRELDHLREALEAAEGGHGQVVALVGEPGIGKSRLLWEFTGIWRTKSWPILECGALSYGAATPYLPLITLLKRHFGIDPGDDSGKRRERIERRLSVDLELQRALPAFLWLLGLDVDDLEWQRLDPPQRRQLALAAIRQLLLHQARVQPLILIVEDLHWVDAETQTLLDSLVDSISLSKVLLLVNYRPEYRHAWASKTYYRQLRIDSLPPENADALLESLLGHDSAHDDVKRMLIERTEGNPFFLEESVRALTEAQVPARKHDGGGAVAATDTLQIPSTIHAILTARMDRLMPEDKRLLQAASVIGPEVSLTLISAIAECGEAQVQDGLRRLQAAEFVCETNAFPDLEYTFRHALTHEVAYASLTHERRKTLHRLAIEAIERLYSDSLAEHFERLAEHSVRAESWEKALVYLREAGSKALSRSANVDSARYFERTLEALRRLPQSPDAVACDIDVRIDIRNALAPLGRLAEIHRHLRAAESLAQRANDQERLGWTYVCMAHYSWLTADLSNAGTYAARAEKIASALSDVQLRAAATYYGGTTRFAAGDYVEAIHLFEKTIRLLTGTLQRERCRVAGYPSVMARAFLVYGKSELGDFDEGIAAGTETLELADGFGHPYTEALAYCWVGHLYLTRGEFREATRLLEHGMAVCRRWNVSLLTPQLQRSLGQAYIYSGREAEGIGLIEQAINTLETMGFQTRRAFVLARLAEAYTIAGRPIEARGVGARALSLSRDLGERGTNAWAHYILAQAESLEANCEESAERHYYTALEISRQIGMRPLIAHCHSGLAKLHRHAGKRPLDNEHFANAATMYREMGMTYWLEKAEAGMEG